MAQDNAPSENGGRLTPLVYLSDNAISLTGVLLTTTAGVAWLFLLPVHIGEELENPYLGILTVMGLPAIFLLGLVLIPVGIRLKERKVRRKGLYPSHFPPLRWANPAFRHLTLFIFIATAANVLIGGHLSYSAVEYMNSNNFCGQTCHVMAPQFVAYGVAAHSQVQCIDCHIGDGAGSYVEAKLNGVSQLVGVLTSNYVRPIPVPVHNFAQGSLTCGRCHQTDRDFGSKDQKRIEFAENENNTATRNEVLFRIGGATDRTGAHGAHLQEGLKIEYRSSDGRLSIPWVRATRPDGSSKEYVAEGWDAFAADGDEVEHRAMDCIDCHNRPGHTFEQPDRAINRAMTLGRIDPSLPWVKQVGMRAVQAKYETGESAAAEIPLAVLAFYEEEHPEVAAERRTEIEEAGNILAEIYSRNVFPEMDVGWGSYPNHLGHREFPGCFRCHDGKHRATDQTSISNDCWTCHDLLALEEPVDAVKGLTEAQTAERGWPVRFEYSTMLGMVGFDHLAHIGREGDDCTACHTRLFAMEKGGDIGYAPGLHKAAEATKTSCANCHVAGGNAFASANNCERCHTSLGAPPAVAAAIPLEESLPKVIEFEAAAGSVSFDHGLHNDMVGGDCVSCHNGLFSMSRAPLGYGPGLHKTAEQNGASCAGCHAQDGAAFGSEGSCERCHAGLGSAPTTAAAAGAEASGGPPETMVFETEMGVVNFGHSTHSELAGGDCSVCHTDVFPMAREPLDYKEDLHQKAEAGGTSCAVCHSDNGTAFASTDNCERCHAE